MALIVDAFATYGLRGVIKSLLSPHETTSDRTESSAPRYVCARKKYESGRKGRICVYRISDERTNKDGHKTRLYTNVEGIDLDEDERQSFTGIVRPMVLNRGRSLRQKKEPVHPMLDKGRIRKVESRKVAVKPHDSSDEESDSSGSGNTASTRVRDFALHTNTETITSPSVDNRQHARCMSRRNPHNRTSVVYRRQFSQGNRLQEADHLGERRPRVERRARKGREPHYSVPVPITQHRSDRSSSLESARSIPWRKSRTTAIDSNVKPTLAPGKDAFGLLEDGPVDREKSASGVPEAHGSPFRQPGLTPQQSSNLVFGKGPQAEKRKKLRSNCMDDRIAPDVHEAASQLVRDHPLGEVEQKTEACSLSPNVSALGRENFTSGIDESDATPKSRAQVLVGPSRSATSTWVSKMDLPVSTSALHRCGQNGPPGFNASAGITHGATRAEMPRSFPEKSIPQVTFGVPGLVHAQAGALSDRFISTTTPGTPPYTPEKGETVRK